MKFYIFAIAAKGTGKIPSFVILSNRGEAVAVLVLYDYMVVQRQYNAGMLTQLLHNLLLLSV
jgi:hypothetical protein